MNGHEQAVKIEAEDGNALKISQNESIKATPTTFSDSTQSSPRPYAEQGPLINRSKTADERWAKKSSNAALAWPRIRHTCRRAFSEFMGTFILVMFGDGVVAQVVLSGGENGDYQSISWGWVCID